MRTWVKSTTPAALLALGVMTLGSGTAFADTSGDNSVGGGNQVNIPISLPIDISGNAVGVVGDAAAGSKGGASVENTGGNGIPGQTSGRGSVLGGNQVNAPITAPINACGNALSLFGSSEAGCKGGASVRNNGRGGAGGNRTSGDHSVLGGNQVVAPITAPINICGNSVAILGKAFSGCRGGAEVTDGGRPGKPGKPGRSGKPGYPGGHGGHGGWRPGSTGNDTDGRFGAGSGNQVIAPITAPITACGNAVGNASAGCEGGASVKNGGGGAGGNRTSGRSGVLAGNQVVAPITAPINVCGNAVAVLGKAFAGCKGGASVNNGGAGAGGNRTSGRSGVLAGNQVVAPITAPINICGNAVAVLGDAAAGCLGGSHVGRPGGGGHHDYGHWAQRVGARKNSGLVPALPVVPALGAGGIAQPGQRAHGADLPQFPLVGEAQDVAGLPGAPAVPGTPATAQSAGRKADSPLTPATDLVSSTPIGGALPVGDLGLMSAAQPAGVTGMNPGSLAALLAGVMAAASATLFATTRRVRFGRK